MKRSIEALFLPGVAPATASAERPAFRWVAPHELLVDETYQRNLSDQSVTLIKRIVQGWDWRRFKPPIVVETAEGLEVIDGQHTAIAAATNPSVVEIPVMLVHAAEVQDRAQAFLGHNRDRLQVTATQMHFAAVAAGDPDALDIEQVCERAGVRVLRHPPSQAVFKPGETMAVAAIGALIRAAGVQRARQVLQVLADAQCTPVRAEAIRAATWLMTRSEYRDLFLPEDLAVTIRGQGEQAYRDGKVLAVEHKLPNWRGLAMVWFRKVKRVRRQAA